MRGGRRSTVLMIVAALGSSCRKEPPVPVETGGSGPPVEPSTGSSGGGARGTDEGADETATAEPPEQFCDVWLQDCSPGYKCAPRDPEQRFAWTASRCVPVHPSPVALGEACTMPEGPGEGIDDCPAGSFCYFSDLEGQEGQCLPFCTGSPENPSCPEGMACGWSNDGVVALCRPLCDPLAQDCGPSNATCLPTPSGAEFVCFVHQWDQGGLGCIAYNSCPPGSMCVPGEWVDAAVLPGYGRCAVFCGDELHVCPVHQTCSPWPDGTEDGHPSVGLCLLP